MAQNLSLSLIRPSLKSEEKIFGAELIIFRFVCQKIIAVSVTVLEVKILKSENFVMKF